VYGLEGANEVLYELLVTCRKAPRCTGPGNSLHRVVGGGDRQRAGDGHAVGPAAFPRLRTGMRENDRDHAAAAVVELRPPGDVQPFVPRAWGRVTNRHRPPVPVP
jgi:hypothetical protein